MEEQLVCNRLVVDKALYTSIVTVLKTLDSECQSNICSVNTLIEAKKGKGFHKTQKEVFMGTLLSQVSISQSQSLRLTVQEVSLTGQLQAKYTVFLYKSLAEEFLRGCFLSGLKKNEKVLLLFKNAPYKYKVGVDSEIEFHLTEKSNTSMMIKHCFLTTAEASESENYTYLSLTQAADTLAQHCNVYAVVNNVLKAPAITNRNKAHGMLLLVDPSCFEGAVKKTDYPLHIFAASVENFPKVITGDIIRLHRARTEAREDKNGKPDFRVFSERDIVVFPANPNQPPRSYANRFTFSERDAALIEQLRQWSQERFYHPPEVREIPFRKLCEIPTDRPFNLICHLVQHFHEENAVALWVEDGTVCSLHTVSDAQMAPFDSQATQDICNNCRRICVRAPVQSLGSVRLENGAFLFLTDVETAVFNYAETHFSIAQFQVKGAVELLPPRTRYYNTLLRNLGREQSTPQKESATRPEQHELAQPVPSETEVRVDGDWLVTQSVIIPEGQQNKSQAHSDPGGEKQEAGKASAVPSDRQQSEEHSTDQAMAEMSSDVFRSRERDLLMPESPPSTASVRMGRQSLDREENRLLMLINPNASSQDVETYRSHPLCTDSQVALRQRDPDPAVPSLNLLPSQLELSFSEAITSTQKPADLLEHVEVPDAQHIFPVLTDVVATRAADNDGSSSSQGSQGVRTRSGRRMCVVHPRSQISADLFDPLMPSTSSTPGKASPCPVYRANEEVLDIVTQNTQKLTSPKLRSRQSPRQRPAEEQEDEDLFLGISDAERDPRKTCRGRSARNIHWRDENSTARICNDPFVTRIVSSEPTEAGRKRKSSDSLCQESVIGSQDESQSQESDDDSIIVYNPQSQPDLERLFSAVEKLGSQDASQMGIYFPSFMRSIGEPLSLEPGARFRIKVRISSILPLKPSGQDQIGLEDLLIAFCFECQHIWQYHHFKHSTSVSVRRKRKLRREVAESCDSANRVINVLCSEEEYQENLRSLMASKDLDENDSCYELDELCNIDNSYVFVCPMCKLDGKPDVLCQLQPSFFFWLHVRDQQEEADNCLHVLATGMHAEYFLGSKADQVCRSEQVWHRAKQRLEKLLEDETRRKPITLSVRKSQSHPDELYLEDTYVVYNNKHVLPW